MTHRSLHVLVLVAVLYVAVQMLADIAGLRIVSIAGFSIAGGTLIYPVTFTLRDMVHKVSSASIARLLIFASGAINLFMAGLLWLVSQLPPDLGVGEQAEFGMVLAPVVRISLASIIAEIISELIDTEIYELWVKRFEQRWQWGRVLASNAISVPVDTVLFTVIAFAGLLPNAVLVGLFVSNMLMKTIITFISIPGIYLVKEQRVDLGKASG
ncbi:MAG: queuosine precursor transporter [Chloroflexi bacterium]|nr:queuosine precursor transporter [Chloroflexota bacterium]